MSPIESIAKAIAMTEGFYTTTRTRAQINNNPGNMRASCLNRMKDDKGFVKFNSPEEGFAALIVQLALFIARGYTLRQIITTWAPPTGADGGNNTAQYILNVVKATGLDPDTKLMNTIYEVK